MKTTRELIALVLACLALAGCATRSEPPALYDLGPLRATSALPFALPPISVAEVNAPAWLDSPAMFFRLSYANDQQPRPYASSRWAMPPAQLFGQRVKARLAQAGGVVLSATDGAANAALLRIETDEFMQRFDRPGHSVAHVSARASVFNGRALLAQKTFDRQAPAPSADAPGGARALADASDAVISDMMTWLATLPLKK